MLSLAQCPHARVPVIREDQFKFIVCIDSNTDALAERLDRINANRGVPQDAGLTALKGMSNEFDYGGPGSGCEAGEEAVSGVEH